MAGEVYRDVVVRVSVVPKDTRGTDALRDATKGLTDSADKYEKLLDRTFKRMEELAASTVKLLEPWEKVLDKATQYQRTTRSIDLSSHVRQTDQIKRNWSDIVRVKSQADGGTYSLDPGRMATIEAESRASETRDRNRRVASQMAALSRHVADPAQYRMQQSFAALAGLRTPDAQQAGTSTAGGQSQLSQQFGGINESVGKATDGLLKMQRGLALLEVNGGKSLQSTIEAIAKMQARIDLFRGSMDIVMGLAKGFDLLRSASAGAATAQAAASVAGGAAASRGGVAGGSMVGGAVGGAISGRLGGLAAGVPGFGLALAAGGALGFGIYSTAQSYFDKQRRYRQSIRNPLQRTVTDSQRTNALSDFQLSRSMQQFDSGSGLSDRRLAAQLESLQFQASGGRMGEESRINQSRDLISNRLFQGAIGQTRAFEAAGVTAAGRPIGNAGQLAEFAREAQSAANNRTSLKVTEGEFQRVQRLAEMVKKTEEQRVELARQDTQLLQQQASLYQKILDTAQQQTYAKQEEAKAARESVRSEEARFGRMSRGDQVAAQRVASRLQSGQELTERDARVADRLGLFQQDANRFWQQRGRDRGSDSVLSAGQEAPLERLRARRAELAGLMEIEQEQFKAAEESMDKFIQAVKTLGQIMEKANQAGDTADTLQRTMKVMQDQQALRKTTTMGF